jgi:chemotaxis protein CheC
MFNTGMGSAAAELSDLVEEEVHLSVPDFQLLPINEVISRIGASPGQIVNIVSVRLSGDIDGDGMLLFPETRSLDLVRTFADGDDQDINEGNMTGQELEALTEVSGIVLNHLITTLSDFLSFTINTSIPTCYHDNIDYLLATPEGQASVIMFVGMSFSVKSLKLNGDILFLQNLESTEAFISRVQKVLDESGIS